MENTTPILELLNIGKRFPGVVALDNVSLSVDTGEIVALIGENGAGKSTLMKILGGAINRDSGTVKIEGKEVEIKSPSEASALGIEFIHQELSVLDNLDVAANIFLRREPTIGGPLKLIDRKRLYSEADQLLQKLGLDLSSRTSVSRLSIAQQQLVEIARAISTGARIIIMDEPTSSLTLTETQRLLEIVMGYRIIADVAGLPVANLEDGSVLIDDLKWNGYLANITPGEFEAKYALALPQSLGGADFLDRFHGITDSVTAVRRDTEYPVLQATKHPIYEHARVTAFASIIKYWEQISQSPYLGRLMFESHQSYSNCGLGSEATDLIVNLAREMIGDGIYGARITGGGSGGTVAVLGNRGSSAAIERLRQEFQERTGYLPLVISGSSPGTHSFDHLKLQLSETTNSSSV